MSNETLDIVQVKAMMSARISRLKEIGGQEQRVGMYEFMLSQLEKHPNAWDFGSFNTQPESVTPLTPITEFVLSAKASWVSNGNTTGRKLIATPNGMITVDLMRQSFGANPIAMNYLNNPDGTIASWLAAQASVDGQNTDIDVHYIAATAGTKNLGIINGLMGKEAVQRMDDAGDYPLVMMVDLVQFDDGGQNLENLKRTVEESERVIKPVEPITQVGTQTKAVVPPMNF